MMRVLLATASVLALLAAPALAATTPAPPPPGKASVKLSHLAAQGFVNKAGAGNIAEVQAGELAMRKSDDPAVQEFGRWMKTDHTMANALLMQAVKSSNLQVPTTLNPAQTNTMQRLQKLSGMQFNRQYINDQVVDHQNTIKLFRNEAQSGQNAPLKTYAKAMLPASQAHLREAEDLQSNLAGSRTAAGGASGTPAAGNTAVGAANAHGQTKVQHR